jgi:hypothetical protein
MLLSWWSTWLIKRSGTLILRDLKLKQQSYLKIIKKISVFHLTKAISNWPCYTDLLIDWCLMPTLEQYFSYIMASDLLEREIQNLKQFFNLFYSSLQIHFLISSVFVIDNFVYIHFIKTNYPQILLSLTRRHKFWG